MIDPPPMPPDQKMSDRVRAAHAKHAGKTVVTCCECELVAEIDALREAAITVNPGPDSGSPLTLDEAISHASSCPTDNPACKYEHDQLAGWLWELKVARAVLNSSGHELHRDLQRTHAELDRTLNSLHEAEIERAAWQRRAELGISEAEERGARWGIADTRMDHPCPRDSVCADYTKRGLRCPECPAWENEPVEDAVKRVCLLARSGT